MSQVRTVPGTWLIRAGGLATVALVALATACSEQETPTAAPAAVRADAAPAAQVAPITPELLSLRHTFSDDVAVQVRVKPAGRSTEVVNIKDASETMVMRFTVQPGARFPWHSHPGLVLVSVIQGSLTFVYADDCVQRPYPHGTAFVDPGFGNIHTAFNPTQGETVIIATFLGLPPGAPPTNVVDAQTESALNAKCGVAAAMANAH